MRYAKANLTAHGVLLVELAVIFPLFFVFVLFHLASAGVDTTATCTALFVLAILTYSTELSILIFFPLLLVLFFFF